MIKVSISDSLQTSGHFSHPCAASLTFSASSPPFNLNSGEGLLLYFLYKFHTSRPLSSSSNESCITILGSDIL